jgi:hypothetical protein
VVVLQAYSSLNNRTEGTSPFVGTTISREQYDPKTAHRCCDRFHFAVHPVFGVFYNIRLPLRENIHPDAPFYTRNLCFRRRFHSKPIIKAMTPSSVSVTGRQATFVLLLLLLLLCLLFVVCCFVVLLFVARCLLFCCLLLGVCCLLFVVCCLLFVVCCLLFVVCCLLFVVCCLLRGVCCR